MGKYVRILCGMMAVLVAATALGLWQLAEAPQYVAAAESRGQAKPVSFGTDTALVPVHLESQTQEEQLVLRVLAADTEEPVRGALFVVELIDGDGQKTVCKDWDLDGVITTEAMPEGDYTAHLRTLAGFLMQHGVDTLICGGIGGGAKAALAEAGIRLYCGASGSADEAARALLNGTLVYNADIVCSHHHEHERGHDNCHTGGCGGSCHHE